VTTADMITDIAVRAEEEAPRTTTMLHNKVRFIGIQ
jgi:hypothetical protein